MKGIVFLGDKKLEIQDYILLNLAKAELKNKNFEQAQRHILTLIKNFPETQLYPEAKIIISETYSQNEFENKAAEIFQETITTLESSPYHKNFQSYIPEFIFKLALNQEKLGKKSEAYFNYRQLYIKYPNHERTADSKTTMKKLVASHGIKEVPLNLEVWKVIFR